MQGRENVAFFSSVLDLDGSFSRRDGYLQTDWTHWTEGVGKVCTCVVRCLLISSHICDVITWCVYGLSKQVQSFLIDLVDSTSEKMLLQRILCPKLRVLTFIKFF